MAETNVLASMMKIFFMHVVMASLAPAAPVDPAYHQQLTDFRQRVANGQDGSQHVRVWLSNIVHGANILTAAYRETQEITSNECAAILHTALAMFHEERMARHANPLTAQSVPAITQ